MKFRSNNELELLASGNVDINVFTSIGFAFSVLIRVGFFIDCSRFLRFRPQ